MATQRPLFEGHLLDRFKGAQVQTPITLHVGNLIVWGHFSPKTSDSPEWSRVIIVDDARIMTPTGEVLEFDQWECRPEAVIGVAFQSPQVEAKPTEAKPKS